MKDKTKKITLALIGFCFASLQYLPAFATADSLELVCPAKTEEEVVSCKISGYSNTPIDSITASFSKLQNAKYKNSKAVDGSSFTIKASNSSVTISSSESFKGAFEIGTIDFAVASTEKSNTTTTINIELSNVLFTTGETESSTAIGSTTSTIAPYVPLATSTNTTTNTTNNTTNTTTSNTTKEIYTKKEKNTPLIILAIGGGIIIIAVIVILFIMNKKKSQKQTPVAPPMPIQRAPINQVITPSAPLPPTQPVLPVAPRPVAQPQPSQPQVSQAPTTQPQTPQPTGISVKNLPFENANSNNPMSFES